MGGGCGGEKSGCGAGDEGDSELELESGCGGWAEVYERLEFGHVAEWGYEGGYDGGDSEEEAAVCEAVMRFGFWGFWCDWAAWLVHWEDLK